MGLRRKGIRKLVSPQFLAAGLIRAVTSIFTAYAAKHHFDEMQYLDIVDCNAGDHGKTFATNFNPEIIRERTQKGR